VGDPLLVGEITAGRFAAQHDAATFSQATRHGGAAIVDAVLAGVDDVVDGAAVLELFCGAGHLTLPLASRAAHVVAIEGDPRAIRHLRENRRLVVDGGRRIDPRVAYIDASLALPVADVVVIDPPRTGLVDGGALLSALAAMRPRRLVMVSCDPATGARDLRAAVEAGFQLERVVPIDAFPRTHHLEWVATLSRG
jgi:tRNA/tmRNA/rRNA uracil-C5-methylase (TrmA/RlmC/RlmD family)